MIGVIVVSHGALATELLRATEHVVGEPLAQAEAVAIGPDDDPAERRRDIFAAVERVDSGEGVIVLTDMFGGTPSNIALSFLDEHRVEVVTGVNLPMLIKLATLGEEKPLDELATFIKGYGQRNISVASELLPDEGS